MILHPAQPVDAIPNFSGQVESTKITPVALSGGVNEVQTIVCDTFANHGQGDYFVISNVAGDTYAVWLDKDANGTAPTGAAYVASTNQIEVDVITGDTAAQVATKVKTAMEADGTFAAENITLSINSATITATQDYPGNITAPARHNTGDTGDGAFTVATGTGGVIPTQNSKYFLCSSSSTNYYVWLNINSLGSDPSVATKTGIEVALNGDESLASVGTKIATAVNAISGLTASADSDGNVYIRNDTEANVPNAADGDYGVTVNIQVQGQQERLAPSTSPSSISNNPSVISAAT